MRIYIYPLAWLGLFVQGTAMANDATFTPENQNEICTTVNTLKIVDRDKLASKMLANNPVNIANIEPPATTLDYQGLIRYIVGHDNVCGTKCKENDKANLGMIQTELSFVWLNKNSYYKLIIPQSDQAEYKSNNIAYLSKKLPEYFEIPNENNYIRIACLSDEESKQMKAMIDGDNKQAIDNINGIRLPPTIFISPQKPAPQVGLIQSLSDFRLRGKVDDIFIDRSQTAYFKATTPATLSYSKDYQSQTSTETFQAVLGYAGLNLNQYINGSTFGIDMRRFELIPYVGVNRLIVNTQKGSSTQSSANETVDVGFSTNAFILAKNAAGYDGHAITLRPHYLMDLQSNSNILALDGRWVPYPDKIRFNAFRALGPWMSINPMLDFRIDGGTYIDRGYPLIASSNKDYLRMGGQAGISILSDVDALPFSFLATYTGLYGVVGNVNIGYFNGQLTYNFDPKKYFGITAGYSNGNLEDNAAKRENMWTVSLSGRY